MKTIYKSLITGIIFSIIVWILDAIIDFVFFYDRSLLEISFTDVPYHEIYIRSFFSLAIIVFSVINGLNIIKIKKSYQTIFKNNYELDAINQQLRANEQQLRANEQQLRANEQQLKATIDQLHLSQDNLAQKAHQLQERVKELSGLYKISEIISKYDQIPDILQKIVEIIPPAWHYPSQTAARIIYNEKEYITPNFKQTSWMQSADIFIDKEIAGRIEVYYLQEMPTLDEGPFMKEERNLINNIADIIARAIEKINYQNQVIYDREQMIIHQKQFKALFNGINDIMYVSDPETYEIIHVNDIAKKTYGEDILGKKCYEVFQNKSEVCSFCTNKQIFGENIGKTYIWEFKNNDTKKWYRCADKAIQWPDGRTLRFELATDITNQVALNEKLLATNQQLVASEQQLMASNQQLIAKEQKLNEVIEHLKQEEKTRDDLKLRMELANKSAGIGVWDLDLVNNKLIWDEWMYKIYEIDPKDFEGAFEAWQKGVHPEDLEKANEEVNNAVKGIIDFNTEFRIVTPSGKIKFLKATAIVIRDKDNNPIKMIGVNYDISNIKNIDLELKSNEIRYQRAEKIAHVGSWEYDLKTEQFWGSDEAKRIYGFSLDDNNFTTEEVENCIPERERVHQALIDLIEKEKPYNLTFEIITKDKGIKKTIQSIAVLDKDENNQVYRVSGAILDITKQKQFEEQLLVEKKRAEENEYRFKALHNASFGGITIHDKGLILDCNQGLSEITGYSIEELIGMDGLLLIAEETRDKVRSNILAKYEKPYEAIGQRKNGQKYPLRLEARMIPYHGKEVRVVEFRDITEQKRVEEQLIKAKKKAEENDELKSAFLANMSHEIRTPMNGILGFTTLLEEPDLTGEEKSQYIEIIKRSGLRMLNTVNDIIDISKIDSGQMELNYSTINLSSELTSLYSFFKPEVNNKGLEFRFKLQGIDDKTDIKVDRNKLNSILTNLIKNAIKYTDEGYISIEASILNSKFVCTVKDTGIGIPKNKLKGIFNRFEQAHINDLRAREGSGLGLAITKSYVEMMKGEIILESKSGKGSTFTIQLPI